MIWVRAVWNGQRREDFSIRVVRNSTNERFVIPDYQESMDFGAKIALRLIHS